MSPSCELRRRNKSCQSSVSVHPILTHLLLLLQVVALFASDGAALQHHHQVAANQESFCRLLFR